MLRPGAANLEPVADRLRAARGSGSGRRACVAGLLALAAGCAPAAVTVPPPTMDPVRDPPTAVDLPTAPPPLATPSLAPSEAFRRGLMPLASTNAWAFRQNHPTYDGRGVLIGILDSGIDPGIAGLWLTSTGDRKLVDLRDFSGEGAVPLARLTTRADTATVGGRRIAGLGRIAALNATGALFAGTFRERPLGEPPASDLNGDGDDADTMILIVTKAPDGWVVFADTDGDGTLADERPIHDFLATKETFGWTIPGRPTPLTIAANFAGTDAAPTLDLFFDTSGHGSHVAGIAAGADLYGIRGFDGVAPGAQLLGLKIANNAHGGISVTGSMIRAIDYAITFARSRSLPLVLNMSFGVGNEREGAARIDAIIDSVLAANPEVVFVTSAGNDGPGLSTMGFPGSADRVISAGATLPPSYIGGTAGDVIAFFSARGGEVAKPDLLAPGIAYSSVPRWNIGDETKNGTSMASPHIAGAVALILSSGKQEKRTVTAGQIKQALVATARTMPGRLAIDQGAGLLDVVAADRLLRRLPAMAVIRARIGREPAGGMLRIVQAPPADTTVTVTVEGGLAGPIRLVSNVGFITVPGSVQLTPPRTTFQARIGAGSLTSAPIAGGVITGWATDTTIGPLFRLPVTLVRAARVSDSGLVVRKTLGAADLLRVFFPVDSARPFRVRFSTTGRNERVLAFLHEPGGQPSRGDNGIPAGAGQATAIELDGRDVIGGVYEAIASASPADPATANVQVDLSPVRLRGERILGDSVRIELANLAGARVLGTAMFGMIGAERGMAFGQRGSGERRIPFRVPAWGRRVVVDLVVPRAQWPAFTDFGLSIVASNGRILETAPLNYAYGRATLELPADSSIARDLEVVLTPAFADPTPTTLWDADLTIRVYAETPVLVDIPSGAEFSVDPRQNTRVTFPLGRFPWTLEDGFFPLGNLVVDVGGVLWGREVRLPPAAPPVMR